MAEYRNSQTDSFDGINKILNRHIELITALDDVVIGIMQTQNDLKAKINALGRIVTKPAPVAKPNAPFSLEPKLKGKKNAKD